jgi:hypothetical protein
MWAWVMSQVALVEMKAILGRKRNYKLLATNTESHWEMCICPVEVKRNQWPPEPHKVPVRLNVILCLQHLRASSSVFCMLKPTTAHTLCP